MVEDGPLHEGRLQTPVDLRALGVAGQQLALQAGAGPGQAGLGPARVILGRDQLLLGLLDHVQDGVDQVMGAERVVEGGRAQLAEDAVDHQPPLCLVGDPEGRRDPEPPAPVAQHPLGEGVVVEEGRVTLERAVGALDPVAHLGGGLAGVGEHQQAIRRRALPDQAEEPLDDDPRLAGAWSGQDQAGPRAVIDGSPLRLVQIHGRAAGRLDLPTLVRLHGSAAGRPDLPAFVRLHGNAARRPVPGVSRRLRWEIEHPPMIPDGSYICLQGAGHPAGRLLAGGRQDRRGCFRTLLE